jgi:hypothetical protein
MYESTLSLTSELRGVGGQRHAPGRFTPGKVVVPIVEEAGWAPRPVWAGAEKLAPIKIRSPYRPVRNESHKPSTLTLPTLQTSEEIIL